MPARSLPSLLALLVAAGCWAACGDTSDPAEPTAAQSLPHWSIHEGEGALVALALPDARRGMPDPDGGPPRLVVNVLASGDVMLKNHTWRPSSGDEAARAASLEGLRTQLEELTVAARKRGGDEGTPLPVLLYADREASWRAIRDVLTILREPLVGTQRLQWAVQTADPAGVSGRVDGALGPAPEAHAAPLVLRIVADRGEAWTVVRIFGPTGIHSFGPQATGIADEAFLRKANATWNDLERALPALAEKHPTAHVEVQDAQADVWFAYVVKTVDLLFGAGYDEVVLPQEGLVLARPAGGS